MAFFFFLCVLGSVLRIAKVNPFPPIDETSTSLVKNDFDGFVRPDHGRNILEKIKNLDMVYMIEH